MSTTDQPRCPDCGRFCGVTPVTAGPTTVWAESCLNCGNNVPDCCFEDGTVTGCSRTATHLVPDATVGRLWCADHAPDDADPLPYTEADSK